MLDSKKKKPGNTVQRETTTHTYVVEMVGGDVISGEFQGPLSPSIERARKSALMDGVIAVRVMMGKDVVYEHDITNYPYPKKGKK